MVHHQTTFDTSESPNEMLIRRAAVFIGSGVVDEIRLVEAALSLG